MNKEKFYSELLTWEENNKSQIRPIEFLNKEIKDIELPHVIDDETQLIWKLEYVYFINSTISNSKFTEITFSKIDFFGWSYIEESQFEMCKFEKTNIIAWFNNVYIECKFNNCKIDLWSFNAKKKKNVFINCNFKNCKFLIDSLDEFDNCIFEDSSLGNFTINKNSNENEFKFINCKIGEVNFTQDVINGFHFIDCIINDKNYFVNIQNKTLIKCTFNGINLSFNNCQGDEINFNHSSIKIYSSVFPRCSFSWANINSTNSNLESGIFYNSKIGELSNCNLENSSFLMANFAEAKLNDNILDNVDFADIHLDSKINSKSHIDNIFFIQISTNILGYNKLTYCPTLNKLYLKFETSNIPKELGELDSSNFKIRKYETDFFREQDLASSTRSQILSLMTSPENFVLIINSFFINNEITKDPLIALKIIARKPKSFGDNIVEIPQNHFKSIGENLLNALSYLTTFKDDLH
jgi:uncharacterized protein YjbI with pentapeptide repeats